LKSTIIHSNGPWLMELDIEDFDALRRYLKQYASRGEPVSFEKLKGGVSNRVVRVTWADGHDWVVKQALAKLRVSVDWFSSPERIVVEARALRWLNRLAPSGTTPSLTFEDAAAHLMAMEAIPIDHENWKSVLLSGRVIPDHFEQFGSLLGTIHRKSAESGPELRKAFADTSYFDSLRLGPYYRYAAQNTPAAASFLETLAEETLRHKLSLVHGDFSPKNALVYRGKLILLDYEVVHFGDPAFDVGFGLTHFLSKAHHLGKRRTRLANAAALFWRVYFNEITPLGWNAIEPRAVRHTLGCLLARVAGKSPLEYLTAEEATRQKDVTLQLIANPPITITDLIARFIQKIEAHAEN
jgi:5-methylthioribose kinase